MLTTKLLAVLTAIVMLGSTMAAINFMVWADSDTRDFKARLAGFNEVPAISTTGTGTFQAKLNKDGTILEYELSYSGLSGGTVSAAHIHLGASRTNGGVIAFLCGGGGKPACPATGGTVTGMISITDVVGPAGQGIAAGEFDEFVRAVQSGVAYANVHTTPMWPGGEIRGQINENND